MISQTPPSGVGVFGHEGALRLQPRFALEVGFLRHSFVVRAGEQNVKRGHDEEGKNGADAHPADQHETDRVTRRRARASHESKREVTADGGDRRHQNRP